LIPIHFSAKSYAIQCNQSKTARGAGVSILFTEDLQDQQVIEGIKIVNPFNDEDFFE